MKPVLIYIRPLDQRSNQRIEVRVADGGAADDFAVAGYAWDPAVYERPRLSIELMSPKMDGEVQAGEAQFGIMLNAISNPRWQDIYWRGASVVIHSAGILEGQTAVTDFWGYITSAKPNFETQRLDVTARVSTSRLEKPLLTEEFTGGGGAGGDPEKRGVLYPAGFGKVQNLEPVWFDSVRNIGMIDGYGNTLSVEWLGEGRSSFGAPTQRYDSYAGLAAAIDAKAVPPGRWAYAIVPGGPAYVGLGAPATGIVTVDATFGAPRVGAMMKRILRTHAKLPDDRIQLAAFDMLDGQVNRPVHYWTSEQRVVKELLEALAQSANATPLVSFQNVVSVTRAVLSNPVATLIRDGGEPTVTDWQQGDIEPPHLRLRARAARPAKVLTLDQVNYVDTIIDRGLYDPATVYRAGNLVYLPDGSQWLYQNDTPGSGHAPPANQPPDANGDVADAYWFRRLPPRPPVSFEYADGTPIEALKPAAPGATRNRVRGDWVPGTTYLIGDIVLRDGSSYDAIADHVSTADNGPPGSYWVLHAAAGKPGESAYTVILTNETHTLPANAAGDVVSYAGAETSIIVLYGATDVTGAFTSSIPPAGNPQDLVLAGQYPAFSVTGGFDAAEAAASITFRLTGNGPHAGVEVDRVWSLAKSKDGGDGSSPALLTILGSTQTINTRADGTLIENTGRIFAVQKQNTAEPTVWRVYDGAGTLHREYQGEAYGTDAQDLLAIINYPASQGQANTRSCVIRATAGAATDQISIYAVSDGAKGENGASALSAYLTNETFSHPTDNVGNPTAIGGGVGDGQMRVFYGAMDVTNQCTFTAQLPANLALTVDATGYYQSQFLYADTGYALIVAVYQGQSLVKRVSGSRAKGGANGIAAPILTLSSTEQAFTVDSAGAYKAKTARLTAIPQNSGNAVSWALLNEAGLFIVDWRSAADFVAAGGGTRAIDALTLEVDHVRFAQLLADNGGNAVTYLARIDGTLARDATSINRVKDGENGQAGVSPFLLDLGAASVIVNATYNGQTKPGQLPRNVGVSVKQGTTDAIGLVNIGVSTSQGIAASYANGQVAITQADADGYVEVSATQGGALVAAAKRIAVSRVLDPPPPQTATGVTVKGSNGDPQSTSYLTQPSGLIATVQVPANGSIPISIYAEYSVYADYSFAFRTYAAAFKVVYRVAGSGSAWSDLTGDLNGTASIWQRNTEEYVQGELYYDSPATLTAGESYDFALMVRKASGNGMAAYIEATMRVGS